MLQFLLAESAITVRIIPFRKPDASYTYACLQQQFAVLDCRLHSGIVCIIYHDYRLRKAQNESYLIVCKCCSGTANYVFYPVSMKGDHVKLAFYQVGEASSGYCLFRLIESENVLTFSENRSLSRIDIFACVIVWGDDSARESDNSTRYIVEREHDAIAEEIVASSIL